MLEIIAGDQQMAKPKFDGVVECVHYKPNGEVDWVRAYERRGPTFSDIILLKREDLIQRLKAGKKYVVGKRKPFLASTFEVGAPIRLINVDGKEILVTDDHPSARDHLPGVPIL